MFFPELPIAAFLLFLTPVWSIYLMLHGHILGGIFLVLFVAPFGYGAYWGLRTNNRWITYGSTLGILIVGLVANSNT
jgi:hypothetical protein